MNTKLLKDLVDLADSFQEFGNRELYNDDVDGFIQWLIQNRWRPESVKQVQWKSQENGRTPESVISTLLVHMNRYAKMYARAAIHGSEFSSPEDFIFLITLRSFGPLSKKDLIEKNVIEKASGIKIIDRLILKSWAAQSNSSSDKRSKEISITPEGIAALELQMPKIRQATKIVSGPLDDYEKHHLIVLLTKLENFHEKIYLSHDSRENIIDEVFRLVQH